MTESTFTAITSHIRGMLSSNTLSAPVPAGTHVVTHTSRGVPVIKPYSKRLRSKQLLSIATVIQGFPLLCAGLVILLVRSPLTRRYLGHHYGRGVLFGYLFYMLFLDNNTPQKGGRPNRYLRTLKLWKHFRAYFPHTVVHEDPSVKIDPSKTYIMACHPHGILSISQWATLFNQNLDAFPADMDYRILTISSNFRIPVWREFLMAFGLIDASRNSIQYCLHNGISIAVVVGGAQESLDARPGTADLTLGRRLGFVRLALENGTPLIPIFSFGETDLFEPIVPNPPGSAVRSIQEMFKDTFKFALPLVHGRPSNPLLPLRRPITTVIGKPVPVPHIPQPTLRDILSVHQTYIQALQRIYDKYKDQFYKHRTGELHIVDKLTDKDLKKWEVRNDKQNAAAQRSKL